VEKLPAGWVNEAVIQRWRELKLKYETESDQERRCICSVEAEYIERTADREAHGDIQLRAIVRLGERRENVLEVIHFPDTKYVEEILRKMDSFEHKIQEATKKNCP
jgi:hypothetical protein